MECQGALLTGQTNAEPGAGFRGFGQHGVEQHHNPGLRAQGIQKHSGEKRINADLFHPVFGVVI